MRGTAKTGLEKLGDVEVLCLALGHQWEHDGGLMLQGNVQEDTYMCRRTYRKPGTCGTEKRELWSRKTLKTTRRAVYKYLESYRVGYRVTREDAKQEARARGILG
jgi:hypothetical protein